MGIARVLSQNKRGRKGGREGVGREGREGKKGEKGGREGRREWQKKRLAVLILASKVPASQLSALCPLGTTPRTTSKVQESQAELPHLAWAHLPMSVQFKCHPPLSSLSLPINKFTFGVCFGF